RTAAFPPHPLEPKLSHKYISLSQKPLNYQIYHPLPLIIIPIITPTTSINLNSPPSLLFFPILLFSRSLYILPFTQIPILRPITPIRRLLFILPSLIL
ncbi:DUF423 domain-containing protein, partial [Staphylococcus hominis]|uniref:DUF423 domain-containing protein n=1 Tax=Staphylococcus hominis TaxID=1290 RepID=UPI0011A7FFDF